MRSPRTSRRMRARSSRRKMSHALPARRNCPGVVGGVLRLGVAEPGEDARQIDGAHADAGRERLTGGVDEHGASRLGALEPGELDRRIERQHHDGHEPACGQPQADGDGLPPQDRVHPASQTVNPRAKTSGSALAEDTLRFRFSEGSAVLGRARGRDGIDEPGHHDSSYILSVVCTPPGSRGPAPWRQGLRELPSNRGPRNPLALETTNSKGLPDSHRSWGWNVLPGRGGNLCRAGLLSCRGGLPTHFFSLSLKRFWPLATTVSRPARLLRSTETRRPWVSVSGAPPPTPRDSRTVSWRQTNISTGLGGVRYARRDSRASIARGCDTWSRSHCWSSCPCFTLTGHRPRIGIRTPPSCPSPEIGVSTWFVEANRSAASRRITEQRAGPSFRPTGSRTPAGSGPASAWRCPAARQRAACDPLRCHALRLALHQARLTGACRQPALFPSALRLARKRRSTRNLTGRG